ncbi:MAG: extracellular solute-binding protein [Anaerolineae bacterium]|nr:extracellular solute-binding protein [Candidatus Roseilinea sp.]MDW8449353.1 extracellular solute-binding protein [Anaerolineae bacterium]
MNRRKFLLTPIASALAIASFGLAQPAPATAQAKIVNVYSARHYGALEKVFAEFTRETGIQVRLSNASTQALLERLRAEGPQTPADVFFVIDIGTLQIAAEEGLLQPIQSDVLNTAIPAELRDPQGRWYALSLRYRTIVYNSNKVKPEELSTYEALADRKWRGRLCMRPATHIYTVSLVASMIANNGEQQTERVLRGWMANRPTFIDSDTRILETIAAGQCDVGITNHYYVGNKLKSDPNFPVKVFWANQKDRGVQVNISGAGVTANAPNRENAIKLLEWLATRGQDPGAAGLPGGNSEYPVNPSAQPAEVLKQFGSFKADMASLPKYGPLQPQAIKLLERVGYK